MPKLQRPGQTVPLLMAAPVFFSEEVRVPCEPSPMVLLRSYRHRLQERASAWAQRLAGTMGMLGSALRKNT